jgi:hypothetical protein
MDFLQYLGIYPRVLSVLGKHSITWANPRPLFLDSLASFAQAGLGFQTLLSSSPEWLGLQVYTTAPHFY